MFTYHAFNHPGMIQVIGAYTSKDAVDVGNPRFVPGVITGNPPTKSDNWIVELSGEQYFWEPQGGFGAPGRGRTEGRLPRADEGLRASIGRASESSTDSRTRLRIEAPITYM